jgi:glycosyltransferase involved in cell wall biosynthesis
MTAPNYGEDFDSLSNFGPQPLVTTVVVTHPGDFHLLPRALKSLVGQLPQGQLEVLVMHDGPIAPDVDRNYQAWLEIHGHTLDFHLDFIATPENSGYYTVARNRSMEFARGLYIAHMDADNEYAPGHLSGLLRALRIAHPSEGWAHFAYTRRLYVKDEGCTEEVPLGPSPFMEWTAENRKAILEGAKFNFIDTGDMLIPRSVLFTLADKTGYVWDSNARRFGDHDLVFRMIGCGFRGRAIDQVTNIYHWTGANLQLTRGLSEVMHIPSNLYDKLKEDGKLL